MGTVFLVKDLLFCPASLMIQTPLSDRAAKSSTSTAAEAQLGLEHPHPQFADWQYEQNSFLLFYICLKCSFKLRVKERPLVYAQPQPSKH